MRFRVKATQLNLRSKPVVKPSTRLAVLAHGEIVERLGDAVVAGWWRVRATVNGVTIDGVVASEHLEPADGAPPATVHELRAVHLTTQLPVRRAATSGRAFPLNEAGQPVRNGTGASGTTAIAKWLRVDASARYQPSGGSTYCNIYAYDYCYLADAYLPRVWWTAAAVARLIAGESVPVQYDKTVRELNANALANWFVDFGEHFGWRFTASPNELQAAVNDGGVGIVVARRVDLNRSGHITAVVPETQTKRAIRKDGSVTVPLQSQAGARNFVYGTDLGVWWTKSQFATFGFWLRG